MEQVKRHVPQLPLLVGAMFHSHSSNVGIVLRHFQFRWCWRSLPQKGIAYVGWWKKITELGVTRLIPLLTKRSVVDPREGKLEKLRQTVIGACKQSGRSHLLEIDPPQAFNEVIQRFPNYQRQMLHPHGSTEPATLGKLEGQLTLIGPEGGFTDDECLAATSAGFSRLSLGHLILRTETAAIAAATLAATGLAKVTPHRI